MYVDYIPCAGLTLLEQAVCLLRERHVELLIRYNADVNIGYGYPIRYASRVGHIEIINALITAGCDVNLHDGGGLTAIHHALEWKGTSVVSRLISAGAILPDGALSLARNSFVDSAKKVEFVTRMQQSAAKIKECEIKKYAQDTST